MVCDIGNTNVVVGIYDNKWKYLWRIETQKHQSVLYYSLIINEHMWEAGIDPKDIEFKSFSTVVPELKEPFLELLKTISPSPVVLLDKYLYDILPLKIINPIEIGTDIVSNSLAAYTKFNDNIIVIDFGTALTFTVIDSSGEIIGVNIAPGIKIAIENLMSRTSQLPTVKIEFPAKPIGTNTVEAIQNGVLLGYIGLIKYMIKVIKNHLNLNFSIVATGGLSSIIYPHIGEIDYIEPNLTLDGLKIAGEISLKTS